jgi:hypothetical protein
MTLEIGVSAGGPARACVSLGSPDAELKREKPTIVR